LAKRPKGRYIRNEESGMTAQTVSEWDAIADKIWATLDRVSRIGEEIAETQKETDRLIKESSERQKETERQMKENAERQMKENAERQKETERQMKENAERQMRENAERQKETGRQMKENAERQMKENAERQKETDRLMKENAERQKETERQMKENAERQMKENAERQKETERQMKENAERQMKENAERQKESDRRMEESAKRLDKQLGRFGNRFGEMVEYMIVPNLVEKFRELGFEFDKTHRDTEIVSRKHDIITEVDVYLENDDNVMIVEIKTKPKVDDINGHIERMEKLRKYADLHNDKRKYLGAMAGVVFAESEKIYALKKGFYVIEPSGDTFNIIEPKGNYRPHEW
jgi:hypothetical protein